MHTDFFGYPNDLRSFHHEPSEFCRYRSALFNESYYLVDGSAVWFDYDSSWKEQETEIDPLTEEQLRNFGRFGYMECEWTLPVPLNSTTCTPFSLGISHVQYLWRSLLRELVFAEELATVRIVHAAGVLWVEEFLTNVCCRADEVRKPQRVCAVSTLCETLNLNNNTDEHQRKPTYF